MKSLPDEGLSRAKNFVYEDNASLSDLPSVDNSSFHLESASKCALGPSGMHKIHSVMNAIPISRSCRSSNLLVP